MYFGSLRRWLPYLIVLAILAAACFLAGNLLNQPTVVQAQHGPALAPDGGGNCTIEEIAIFERRIHVRCLPSTGGIGATIIFFARPADTDIHDTNRMLALLITSEALGRHPYIVWDDNSANNPPGCLVDDCRRLVRVVMQ